MELTQLKQFKVVAETQNITTASQQLFISQPALTRTIYKLERELGTPLFDRSDRKLRLNNAGRQVLAYANMILDTEEKLIQTLGTVEQQNSIRLCTSMRDILTFLIPRLYAEFPELHVHYEYIKSRNAKYYLSQKRSDIAITDQPVRHDSIQSEFLFDNHITISVPIQNPLYNKEKLTFKDLKDETFVTYIENNPISNLIQNVLTEEGIRVISLANVSACNLLAETNNYLVVTSYISSRCFIFDTVRRYIPLDHPEGLSYTYFISYLKENAKEYRELIGWMKKALQN